MTAAKRNKTVLSQGGDWNFELLQRYDKANARCICFGWFANQLQPLELWQGIYTK